jgi:hypothetical protein
MRMIPAHYEKDYGQMKILLNLGIGDIVQEKII